MKTKILTLVFLFALGLLYAQITPKGVEDGGNSVTSQYGFDASQQQQYEILKSDVKLRLTDLDSLKASNEELYYTQRSEIIYKAKMQLKQMLNPDQRRIWREREDALHSLLLERKKELEAAGKSQAEIQKALTEFDFF